MPQVTMTEAAPATQQNRRSRNAMVTFRGAVVHPLGDWMQGTKDLIELLHNSWDLVAIDQSYRDFITHGDLSERIESVAPGWGAPAATAVFERPVEVLEKPALAHASAHCPLTVREGRA
jgi:hypothetical protein